jgi:hypothetical protein
VVVVGALVVVVTTAVVVVAIVVVSSHGTPHAGRLPTDAGAPHAPSTSRRGMTRRITRTPVR